MKTFLPQSFSRNVRFLKARATRQSIFGVVIALIALIAATLFSAFFEYGSVTLAGVVQVQKDNFVLWFLDAMPFIFAVWGQYVGAMIAYEASSLVLDQTLSTSSPQKKTLDSPCPCYIQGHNAEFLFHPAIQNIWIP